MKPMVPWLGGKRKEVKYILDYIPTRYDLYIEPFIGGGALYFHLEPDNAVINDLHPDLINFYKQIQEGKQNEIQDFYRSFTDDKENFLLLRDNYFNLDNDLDRAKYFFTIIRSAFFTKWTMRDNKIVSSYNSVNRVNNKIFLFPADYTSLLQRTKIYNIDYKEIFKIYNNKNYFMFLDPPYDCKTNKYDKTVFTREHHIDLAELFKTTNNKCLMVIAETDFIRDLYVDYISETYDVQYKNTHKINKHLVIKNY